MHLIRLTVQVRCRRNLRWLNGGSQELPLSGDILALTMGNRLPMNLRRFS
jgi:hypothetical protein